MAALKSSTPHVMETHSPIWEPDPVANTSVSRALSIHQQDATTAMELEELPPPATTAVSPPQTWKYPRANFWRFVASNYSFVILGVNDAAYGVSVLFAHNDGNIC